MDATNKTPGWGEVDNRAAINFVTFSPKTGGKMRTAEKCEGNWSHIGYTES